MKILNFGSLNLDRAYRVSKIVRPKETILVHKYEVFYGGKGLNQSVALARAGADVYHGGAVGIDGNELATFLKEQGVDTSLICHLDAPNGHAVIQIDEYGQNSIIVYGGANQMLNKENVDRLFLRMKAGDFLLIQNETSQVEYAMIKAKELKMKIAFNCSPITDSILTYPLHLVDYFIVNEIEGKYISECITDNPEDILNSFRKKYSSAAMVLTVGEQGAYYIDSTTRLHCQAFPTTLVDTTGAGDTFCGYFLAGLMKDQPIEKALRVANLAASLAVRKQGAADSIPFMDEVEMMEKNYKYE